MRKLDFTSIIGLAVGIFLVIFGMVFNQETMEINFATIGSFIHISSMLITFGGSFTCMITMSKSLKEFVRKVSSFRLVLKPYASNEAETIKQIIRLSNTARKEGLLALEETANGIEDEFLKKGILLIVDGTDPELVRSILDTELNCIEERHNENIGFWEKLAAMGPAWGMIGTLIGLIKMLKDLNDVATIGPNMATALVTTFYGSILANWICIPIANKLRAIHSLEIMVKGVMVEGLLSIQAGENPRIIEEKLKSFLPPSGRVSLEDNGEGGEKNA